MPNTAWMPTVTMCYVTVRVVLLGGMLLYSNGRVQHYITLYPSPTHPQKYFHRNASRNTAVLIAKYSLFWFYNEA